MKFDWQSLCEEQGVSFVRTGPNVSRGNINIRCPFCDDHSEHLGLSLDVKKPSWGCWRCSRGSTDPTRLLCRLLNVSADRAKELIAAHNTPNPDDFEGLFDEAPAAAQNARCAALRLPEQCWTLDTKRGSARPFLDYLKFERGFGDDVSRLVKRYDLMYAVVGEQANRIVYPVRKNGELVAWTGRSRFKASPLRYKADDGGNIKFVIGDYDALVEAPANKTLIITEGPFDMMKLGLYAEPLAVTCTFGTAFNQAQVVALVPFVRKFRRSAVLYDAAAYVFGMKLADQLEELSGKGVGTLELLGSKDPGEMTPAQINEFVEAM